MKKLISVIIPVHNDEKYIQETILSVINQSYQNFEIIIVNDCSTDNSKKIIEKNLTDKIFLINLKTNMGVAKARNIALKKATGEYITFLDADDVWHKDKLKTQLDIMIKNNLNFTFTRYEFIKANGDKTQKIVKIPQKINYNQLLKNTIICPSTVMVNIKKINKKILKMPDIKRGQDFATWLNVLKKEDYVYGISRSLTYYRVHNNSLSSNKLKAIKRTWYIYRKVEKLHLIYSIYVFVHYAFNATKKRIIRSKK